MARPKAIDTQKFLCPHPDCPNYGRTGFKNQILGAGRYGKAQTQLLRCKVCGQTFSARRGTAVFGLKTPEEKFFQAIACLVEGNSIRATARICGCDKDTIVRWLKAASEHEFTDDEASYGRSFKSVSDGEPRF
jgi:transposase-like protein